jgi:nicotinamidase-related amidase
VIVECQRGVVGPDSALPALAEAATSVLPVIGTLARAARRCGVPVVHLVYVPIAGNRSSNRRPVLFGKVLDRMDSWGPGHPATEVVPEVGAEPGDLVLPRHQGLSPTHGTETFKILRNLGVATVVLAGVSTNIAVPVIAVEAVDEGFDVIVPGDAVAGTPAEHSASMLAHTLAFVATLTTTAELVECWSPSTVPHPQS